MKVLVVSKALVASTYRRKLDALAELGAEVTAVVPPEWREGGAGQRLEAGPEGKYRLIVSPLRWNGHFHLHYYPDLPRIIRQSKPDILHLDEEPYNLATYLGLRASRKSDVPAIFFSWQNLLRRYPPPFRQVERYVYRHTNGAIAGTDEVAGVLRRKGYAGRLAVIPQFGVDINHFHPGPAPDGPFRVGFLNRLTPGKAPLLALEAFNRLPADSCLEVVGDGPMRGELENAIQRLGLTRRVSVRARIPSGDVPELMRSLHVVLLPSIATARWIEQFGRVLIEAMASGIPAIGSDSGEIPRVLGNAGIITPEGDAAALGDALLELYQNPSRRAELGRLGRERAVERFSHERIARASLTFYEQVLNEDESRGW